MYTIWDKATNKPVGVARYFSAHNATMALWNMVMRVENGWRPDLKDKIDNWYVDYLE